MNRPSPSAPPSQTPPDSDPGFGEEPTQRRIVPSHDALPPGTRFAEYELLSVLSEGQSGIVYLAMDHGLERHVAIKEYLPAALASRGRGTEVTLRSDGHAEPFALGLKSFVNEARLLAHLDHPALVRVYRFWEANRSAYMAMPYYEGVSVGAARQTMAAPPDEAWLHDLLVPLLDALELLHGASCYHWDISPENILLLPDGRPVLLDSGAVRYDIGDRTQADTVILKPAFAPIEQYAESTKLRQGPWTNLYALAAVAYYCVSGQPPVPSTVRALDDQMEPLSQVVDRLGRSFPELNYSVAFVSAIERALNVRPQERPQSVAEFRRALLGGRGAAESVVVPPAVEDASQERSEPWPSDAEPQRQTTPEWEAQSNFGAPAGETRRGSVDDAREAAFWAAFEAAPGLDSDNFGGPPQPRRDANTGGWRRNLLIGGGAALALVVLGAGSWMMWSEYREAKMMQRLTAISTEANGQRAPLLPPAPPVPVPPERPAESPAQLSSDAASEPQSSPAETVAPEAAPVEPTPAAEATVAEALAEAPPPPLKIDKMESSNPRALCGSRTQFSLYRCMKVECERPKYYDHAECKYLRAKDEVRTVP